MDTIYKIIGGGQRVQQCIQYGLLPIEYEKNEDSDWPEKMQCTGQDHFTNCIWSTDLETLREWASTWAGREVELIERSL